MDKAVPAYGLIITVLGIVSCSPADVLENFESLVTAKDNGICDKIIIAHRGASGYVPEHTLGAYALAATMGADFIEPDLVMTSDGHLVARHDNELSMTTDVSIHPEFADRQRTQTIDGIEMTGWFTEDFTFAELKTLRAIERIPDIRPGNARMDGSFTIPAFYEILDLVRGLQHSLNRTIGIYPEIKHATHFQRLGLAMEVPLVQIFKKKGYWSAHSPVYIQSFELMESDKSAQPADQIALGTGLTYGEMASPQGLVEIAKYASAVGPDKSYIIPRDEHNRLAEPTSFVTDCHAAGLKVHPYTFRAENFFLPKEFHNINPLPSAIGDLEGELTAYFNAGVDGLFSDQPDIAVRVRGQCSQSFD